MTGRNFSGCFGAAVPFTHLGGVCAQSTETKTQLQRSDEVFNFSSFSQISLKEEAHQRQKRAFGNTIIRSVLQNTQPLFNQEASCFRRVSMP